MGGRIPNMRRVAVLSSAVILHVSAFGQVPQSAPGPSNWPTAQFAASKDPGVQKACTILNQMLRALGGDAWLGVRTIQSQGRAYTFNHGQPTSMSIQYWRFWEWPDKERVEVTKERDIIEIYNGDKAYETTYKGTVTQGEKETDNYLRGRDHSLESVLRKWLPAQGSSLLYSGTAMVERNLADEITVLNANNDSVTISIDATTHMPVKIGYSWRDPVDRQFDDESVIFSNYKPVQGVQTPYSVVRNRNGEMISQRFLQSVTYNADLAPTLFEPKGLTYQQPGKQSEPKQ